MNNTAVPASPAAVWQTLLTYLLQQHYGLTLNDTEFSDERVCEALNAFAGKYALVRTDRRNNCITEPSHGITATDILRARKATGLITRRSSHIARRHCTV